MKALFRKWWKGVTLRRFRIIMLLVAAIVVPLLAACSGPSASTPTASPGAARGNTASGNQTSAQATRTGTPAPGQATAKPAVVHISADGRLSFAIDQKLFFGTSGKIALINVKELDRVNKGQVLAKLDTTSLDRAVKAAEIAVKAAEFSAQSAEADRTQAEYNVKSVEADLKQMQDNVKSAGIDLEGVTNNLVKISYPYTYGTFSFDIPQAIVSISNAQMNLNLANDALQPSAVNYGTAMARFSDAQTKLTEALQLLGKGANLEALVTTANQTSASKSKEVSSWLTADIWTIKAAQLAVDKSRMAVTTAQNSVGKATLTLANSKTALSKTQIALDKAKNDVDRARNDLDVAKDNLDKATIIAPLQGVVASVNVELGDTLSASSYGSTVAIEVIDPSRLELDFNVNELDIVGVKTGQKVAITVSALPDLKIEGRVATIATMPTTESGVVSYKVETVFDAPKDSVLRAGMAATADITVS